MIAHHDDLGRSGDFDEIDGRGSKAAIDPPDLKLISSPLDFLFAEHLRQRQFAKILALAADDVINRKTIRSVIAFIRADLAQHIRDEEIAFFPSLRRLCGPDDNIDAILDVLAEEHREDETASEAVLSTLQKLEKGEKASEAESAALRDFADHLRRHIALENGVLLPIARARMTAEALSLVAQSLASARARDRAGR